MFTISIFSLKCTLKYWITVFYYNPLCTDKGVLKNVYNLNLFYIQLKVTVHVSMDFHK